MKPYEKPYELEDDKKNDLLRVLKWSKLIINDNIDPNKLDQRQTEVYKDLKRFIADISTQEQWSLDWKDI